MLFTRLVTWRNNCLRVLIRFWACIFELPVDETKHANWLFWTKRAHCRWLTCLNWAGFHVEEGLEGATWSCSCHNHRCPWECRNQPCHQCFTKAGPSSRNGYEVVLEDSVTAIGVVFFCDIFPQNIFFSSSLYRGIYTCTVYLFVCVQYLAMLNMMLVAEACCGWTLFNIHTKEILFCFDLFLPFY